MPPSRRAQPDPRRELARIVERLGRHHAYVTLEEIEAAVRRPSSRIRPDDLGALVEGCVRQSVLLKDARTFFDRASQTFSDRWVYRVNPRHPVVAALLGHEA